MDRDELAQTIYETFAAPYSDHITPALRQLLRICAAQAADRVLAMQEQRPLRARTVTVERRTA
jgi:hypothetical protein